MQLIIDIVDIVCLSIEVFAFGFFVVSLLAYLEYHWRNPHAIEAIKLQQREIEAVNLDCKLDAIPAINSAAQPTVSDVVELLQIADSINKIEGVLADIATAIEAVEAESSGDPKINSVIELPQPATVPDRINAIESNLAKVDATVKDVEFTLIQAEPVPVDLVVLPHSHQEQPDYQNMTRDQLRHFARDRRLKGYGSMTKASLVLALTA